MRASMGQDTLARLTMMAVHSSRAQQVHPHKQGLSTQLQSLACEDEQVDTQAIVKNCIQKTPKGGCFCQPIMFD